jgi:hypothetical protein
MAAVAELVLAALTADHRGSFGLRTDHGISPQLTGSTDFWHPTGSETGRTERRDNPRGSCADDHDVEQLTRR